MTAPLSRVGIFASAVLVLAVTAAPLSAVSATDTDSSAPDVAFTSPLGGTVVGASATFRFSVADSSASHRFLASPSGISYTEAATGEWSEFVLDTSSWREGDVLVTAHAEDVHGNADAGSSADLSIVVDHTAPVVTLSAPSRSEFTVGDDIAVAAAVTELHGSQTELSVDGRVVRSTATNAGGFVHTLATSSWAPGDYTLAVSATDSAGNAGTPVTIVVTLLAAPITEEPGDGTDPADPGTETPGQPQTPAGPQTPAEPQTPAQPQSPAPPQTPAQQPAGGTSSAQTSAPVPFTAQAAPAELPTLPAPTAGQATPLTEAFAPTDAVDEQLDTFALPADDEGDIVAEPAATRDAGLPFWLVLTLISGVLLLALLALLFGILARRRHT